MVRFAWCYGVGNPGLVWDRRLRDEKQYIADYSRLSSVQERSVALCNRAFACQPLKSSGPEGEAIPSAH